MRQRNDAVRRVVAPDRATSPYHTLAAALGDGTRAGRRMYLPPSMRPLRSTPVLPPLPEGDLVYFVTIGELIKIGHSRNIKTRLRQMCVSPDKLLAWEPGGAARERELHAMFRHCRHDSEFFRPEPDLIKYLAGLIAD